MGWSIGFDDNWNRDVGYGVPAVCDHPRCNEEIDRGLSFVCGSEPYGGDRGCGLYFCGGHLEPVFSLLHGKTRWLCPKCSSYKKPYKAKPDTKEWIDFKMTDPSWDGWRKEQTITTKP